VEPQWLGSRYLLEEQIGTGGMGVVRRGRDRVSGAVYAIKVLLPQYAADPSAVARFVRERTVMIALRHPNVVTLHDMIVEGDRLALVMDLVTGGDLGRLRLGQGGRLAPAEAAQLTAQIADALAYAHAAGIVHRDLKPANVLVRAEDEPGAGWRALLADFGIARLAGQPGVTTTGMVMGTLSYMAPEMISGEEPIPAADVYSLGITAYELVAGQVPFTGIPAAILNGHLNADPRRPEGIGDDMWRLISRCLAKRAEDRPSAAEVAAALRGSAQRMPAHRMPAPRGDTPPTSGQTTPVQTGRVLSQPKGAAGSHLDTRPVAPGQLPALDAKSPAWNQTAGAFHQATMGPLAEPPDDSATVKVKRRIPVLPTAVAAVVLVAALVTVAVLAIPSHSGSPQRASAGTAAAPLATDTTATQPAAVAAEKTKAAAAEHSPTAAAVPAATTQTSPSQPPSPKSDNTGWECSADKTVTNSSGGSKTTKACIEVRGTTVHLEGYAWPVPDLPSSQYEQVEVVLNTPSGDVGRYTSAHCAAGTCEYAVTLTEPAGSYRAQADYLWDGINEFQGPYTPYAEVTG
jgi:serine/threonine protein kinase, bacterial